MLNKIVLPMFFIFFNSYFQLIFLRFLSDINLINFVDNFHIFLCKILLKFLFEYKLRLNFLTKCIHILHQYRLPIRKLTTNLGLSWLNLNVQLFLVMPFQLRFKVGLITLTNTFCPQEYS